MPEFLPRMGADAHGFFAGKIRSAGVLTRSSFAKQDGVKFSECGQDWSRAAAGTAALRQKIKATTFSKRARLRVMLGKLRNFLQRKRRGILIASSVVALLITFLWFYEPSTPDGIYYWPDLACGHGVWIFKDGKIYDQCVGENDPREIGSYIKSGNKWIGGGKNGGLIKPSIFGIALYDSGFKNGHEFFFRDHFSWIFDCEEWFQKHF